MCLLPPQLQVKILNIQNNLTLSQNGLLHFSPLNRYILVELKIVCFDNVFFSQRPLMSASLDPSSLFRTEEQTGWLLFEHIFGLARQERIFIFLCVALENLVTHKPF